MSHRGKPNEPAFVGLVARKIAEVKKVEVADVEHASTATASLIFGIGI
jgi:Tat protein secretion system quality control protein TatD with DNase activity